MAAVRAPPLLAILMSDLMKRLALRRDGISGSAPKSVKQSEPIPQSVGAMDRVSALIPPPNLTSDNELSDPDDSWIDD